MAFGRGKVILLGEHAVVYGRPALAAGIASGVHATAARDTDADVLEIAPWGVSVQPDAGSEDPLAQAFAALLAAREEGGQDSPRASAVHPGGVRAEGAGGPRTTTEEGGASPRARVRAVVELPGGAGLGCSAAIAVAVAGALDELAGIERSAEERASQALAWERVFHGNPSGIDTAISALGGVAVYRKGEPLEPLRLRAPLSLVIGHSGEAASTKAMVDMVARQHERAPARLDKTFDAIAALVQNGRLALEAGDLRALGQLMDLDQSLLSSLMLSTARLEELCAAARETGALGAKLTGAGGGGCMIALVPDDASAERVRNALASLGASPFVAEVHA